MRATEPEARRIVEWKLATLEALREQRGHLLRTYHRAKHFIVARNIDKCETAGEELELFRVYALVNRPSISWM